MKKSINATLFLTGFGLFWTLMVLVVDGFVGYGFINQIRSQTFSTTTGHITHSEVTEHNGSDSTTYGVDIRYSYGVGEQTFEGTRFRYGEGSSSDSSWANLAVARHPVGSETKVFYNPHNPSESLLSPGVDGSNLILVVFMTPFNMVMLGFWLAAVAALYARFSTSPTGGVRVIRKGPQTCVRLPRITPVFVGLATTGIVGFFAIFALLIPNGFHPKSAPCIWALIIAYSAGALAALWQTWKILSGASDLVIDASTGTVELPASFGRKERTRIQTSRIHDLTLETVVQTGSEGSASYTYAPTLWTDGQSRFKLAEWMNQKKAEAFTTWLRTEFRLDKRPEYRPLGFREPVAQS